MAKPRKTKVIHFTPGGGFTVATTVHAGKRTRTLYGRPRVNSKTNSIVVGCIYLTRAALAKLNELGPGLYQDGNYKSVEG